jgi:hypothetical protein
MNETLETSPGRTLNVWDHDEGGVKKIWLSVDVNYASHREQAQLFMTPMQARQLAQMLEDACPRDEFTDEPSKE